MTGIDSEDTRPRSLKSKFPDVAEEWDYERNTVGPEEFAPFSSKKAWWICPSGHRYEAAVSSRTRKKTGCPYCSGRLPIPGETDLATLRSDVAAEWHPTKNGRAPSECTLGSTYKAWWLCPRCGLAYDLAVNLRTSQGQSCPYCAGKRVAVGYNDLGTKRPDLAEEWCRDLNEKGPEDYTVGSHAHVSWRCRTCGHVWKAEIKSRVQGRGCPFCSHQAVIPGRTDLATLRSDVAAEWHPTRNEGLSPESMLSKSNKKVWWLCPRCGHEWMAAICDRTNSHKGCPECKKMYRTSFGEKTLAHYLSQVTEVEENYRPPFLGRSELDIYVPGLGIAVEYDGVAYHKSRERDERKNALCRDNGVEVIRVREAGCPELEDGCAVIPVRPGDDESLGEATAALIGTIGDRIGRHDTPDVDVARDCPLILRKMYTIPREKSLLERPDLAVELHPTKNGGLRAENIPLHSNRKIWWRCAEHEGHVWLARVNSRAQGRGCPFCSGKKVLKGFNDLATVRPDLAAGWDWEANGNLRPDMVTAGSDEMVTWRCAEHEGHVWQATVGSRAQGSGCPFCSGKKVLKGFNDLATVRPDLAAEWDYEKNGNLGPSDVTTGSSRKVWWTCSTCGNEWDTSAYVRTKGHGCRKCNPGRHRKCRSYAWTPWPCSESDERLSKQGCLSGRSRQRTASRGCRSHEYERQP